MLCLIRSLLLFSLLHDEDHITFARQTPSRQDSNPSVIAASNISTSPSIKEHSSSSTSASRTIINNHTRALAGANAALPLADIKSANCEIKDFYCLPEGINGTVGKANVTNVDETCLLWDSSCSGNKTFARDTFFDPTFQHDLLGNRCFILAGSMNLGNTSNCDKYNPPGRISEFQDIKNWMRSQQCVSVAKEWTAIAESNFDPDSQLAVQMDPHRYHVIEAANGSCCDVCYTFVDNVDIYYWPEPNVNTSCLSIIGNSIKPIDAGATRDVVSWGTSTTTDIYWGCQPEITAFYDTRVSKSVTHTESTRTAEIRTIGSLLVKVYLSDPWSPSPCTESNIMSPKSIGSIQVRDRHATMYGRDHTLIIQSSITHADNLPVTTMVSGNFTFTSPSVYANFHGIRATDQCGGIIVSSTMIAFAPGELATVAGPLGDADGAGPSALTTKSFNLNDLPCPPQSVMEENWYKPQPGEPYRPLIAIPSKLKEKIPWLSHCLDEFFTAYDPPSTLKPGVALAPPISYSDPKAQPWAPISSFTSSSESKETFGAETSVPVPASAPILDQPKATVMATSAPPKQKEPDPGAQSNDPAAQESPPAQPRPKIPVTNSDPKGENDTLQDSDPNKVNNNNGDSEHEKDPKLGNNPNQVNNDQGFDQDADPIPQTLPKQANPFNGYTEGQAKTLDKHVIQPQPYGIFVAGTTLTRGAPPINVSGTPIHFESAGLVIGTSTVPLAPEVPTRIITTIAGQAIAAAPNGATVASKTLRPGAPGIAIAGTPISLDTASQLMIGSKTIALESASQSPMFTKIGGQVITAGPSGIVIPGTALTPGASKVSVDGTLVSLNTAGQLIVGSKTITLQSGGPGLGGLIIGGSRVQVPSEVADPLTTTIDGHVIAAEATALAMAGTTLTPGAPGITINGTVVSLNTATQLVVGSKTIPLEESAGSSGETAGLGGFIMGAFAPFSTNSPTSAQGNSSIVRAENGTGASVQIFQGSAVNLRGSYLWWRKSAVSAAAFSVLVYIY